MAKTCEICGEPAEFVRDDHFTEAGWPGPLPRYYCPEHRPEDAGPIRRPSVKELVIGLVVLVLVFAFVAEWLHLWPSHA